jgi:DNA-binding NtrC family response regulator
VSTGAALVVKGRRFEELEREIYLAALRDHAGSRRRAAYALGIARSTFCERIKRLGCIALDPNSDKVTFW